MEMRKFWIFLGLACLALPGLLRAEDPRQVNNFSLSPELSEKLEQYAQEGMKKWHSPGLAIGMVKDDQLVWQGYFGWADLKQKKPVTENSVFLIGSVSKTFTAIGLMQQYEQGKFQMDDPVNPCAPYPLFRPQKPGCREVTFLDVFTHTSGGGELMSWRQLGKILPTTVLFKGQERPPLKKTYTDGIRPRICPGTKWAYCNFCFGGLGLILETLSGQSFNDYTDARILKPLGMNRSAFYETGQILENLASGYNFSKGAGFTRIPDLRYPVTPMGGMYSTVPDMARYMIALLHHGRLGEVQLVKPETLELMFTPHYQVDPRLEKIGICFFIDDNLFEHRLIGHDGAMPGYGTQMYVAPDDKIGIIVFANIMNDSAYEIGHGLLKILFNYRKPELDFQPGQELWPGFVGDYGSVEPELLSDYRFFMRNLGIYQVRIQRGQLWLESARAGKVRHLRQVKPEDPYFYEIMVPDSEIPRYLVFVPGKDGKASSLKIGLNQYVRLEGGAKTRAYLKAIAGAGIPAIF